MRTLVVLLAIALLSGELQAQQSTQPAGSSVPAPTTGIAPDTGSPATAARTLDANELPVSLDRIRKALARPAPRFAFNFDVPSTFRTGVHEQDKLDSLIKSFDFRGGPTPAGGLYNYEAQRVMLPASSYPAMQPYAAFNGGELLTLSLEALAEKYVGGRALSAVSARERAKAQAAARNEVLRSIADYCSAHPEMRATEPICQEQ